MVRGRLLDESVASLGVAVEKVRRGLIVHGRAKAKAKVLCCCTVAGGIAGTVPTMLALPNRGSGLRARGAEWGASH